MIRVTPADPKRARLEKHPKVISPPVAAFLLWCSGQGLTPPTIAHYRWMLSKLPVDPALSPDDIMRLYVSLEGQLGPVSLANLDKVLRVFYRWLARRDLWLDIMAEVPHRRLPKQFPRVFTRVELVRISTAARSDTRDAALVAFLLGTGARIGEAANLRWQHVRMGSVTITGKTGPRTIPLPAQAQRLMAGLGDGVAVWVGPKGPLTQPGLRGLIWKLLRRAQVDGKRASCHTFRHTFATEFLRLGGSVQQLQRILGHASILMTMQYVHMIESDLLDGAEAHSPLQLMQLEDVIDTRAATGQAGAA